MQVKSSLMIFALAIAITCRAQVGVNIDGSAPDVSAMLDVKSINKGLLAPRMNESSRIGIGTPANGLLVYQTNNTSGFYYNSGSSVSPAWTYLGLSGTLNYLPKYNGLPGGGNSLIYDNGVNIGIGTTTPLSFGGYLPVGPLTNKKGLTIAAATATTPDAPAVLELIGSTDGLGEELGMIDFIHISGANSYNVARMTAVRESSTNPTFSGLAFYTRQFSPLEEQMRITSGGNVGIGCAAPNYKLHVVGDIAAQGGTLRAVSAVVSTTITACSDVRYKKDIKPMTNVLSRLLQLQGVNYYFKMNDFPERSFPETNQIGFIAQDVEKYYPEIVVTEKDGYKAIDYSRFAPILLEAIKEQQQTIDHQQAQISSLMENEKTNQAKLDQLQSELKMIKKALNIL